MKNTQLILNVLLLASSFLFTACGQSKKELPMKNVAQNTVISKPNNPYYSNTDTKKLSVTNEQWKKVLDEDVYAVSREADTERAFTGKYWDATTKGTYYCAACGNKLFRSQQKFASSCGWPSFFEQDNKNSVVYKKDVTHGMERIEALCGRCDGHLGHLFDDGPEPTGKRYCMNSIALDFIPDGISLDKTNENLETIVLGGGCYWCVEAIYENLKGVKSVVSGFAGGTVKNPTYEEVSSGYTGAAEVIEITYDKNVVSLDQIFEIFFSVHDPTTLNRQGADEGTQYRSAIFYKNKEQLASAKSIIVDLTKSMSFTNAIVTTLEPLEKFYVAEDYHQDYYANNKNAGYCKAVIAPKLEKFEKVFKDRLKK